MIPLLRPRPPGARKKSTLERDAERAVTGLTSTRHGYFNSFDGTQLFYSIEGEGKPLVFCYGLVCSSLHWTYQIEHFRRSHQSVWFDYRGHNNSETPKDLTSLNLGAMARDLGLLLDELKLDEVVLLGHSMGVNVVLELYRQQPHRVKAMVLANGTPRRPLETLMKSNVAQGGLKFLRKAYDFSPELVQSFWKLQKNNPLARTLISIGGFNPHLTPPEDVELYLSQIADMDPRVFLHVLENYDNIDMTAWLHTIDKPTLIIAGENDMVTPVAQQELMHQLIAGSKLEIIRHGSHCPQMDLPELVSLKIENFLRELG